MRNIEAKVAVVSKTEFAAGHNEVRLACIDDQGALNSSLGEFRLVITNDEALDEFTFGVGYQVVFIPMVPKTPKAKSKPKPSPKKRKPTK